MLGKPVRKRPDGTGMALFEYDFDKHGGAVGDIQLTNDVLPDGAVVLDGFVEVKEAVTSGGAGTVAFKLSEAGDVLGVTAKGSLTAGAVLDVVADGTAANMIKVEADLSQYLVMSIGTAALTAGKIFVALRYVMTADTTVQAASSSSSSSSSTSSSSSSSS